MPRKNIEQKTNRKKNRSKRRHRRVRLTWLTDLYYFCVLVLSSKIIKVYHSWVSQSCLRIWEEHPGDTSKSSIRKRDAGSDNAVGSSSGNGNFTELLFHKVEYSISYQKYRRLAYINTSYVTLVTLGYTERLVLFSMKTVFPWNDLTMHARILLYVWVRFGKCLCVSMVCERRSNLAIVNNKKILSYLILSYLMLSYLILPNLGSKLWLICIDRCRLCVN